MIQFSDDEIEAGLQKHCEAMTMRTNKKQLVLALSRKAAGMTTAQLETFLTTNIAPASTGPLNGKAGGRPRKVGAR